MDTLEYYKLIRNSVKIQRVELVSMNCIKRDIDKLKGKEVQILLKRDVKIISDKLAEIYLYSKIGIPDVYLSLTLFIKDYVNQ